MNAKILSSNAERACTLRNLCAYFFKSSQTVLDGRAPCAKMPLTKRAGPSLKTACVRMSGYLPTRWCIREPVAGRNGNCVRELSFD